MRFSTPISLAAPAKVNLTLAVGPPSPPRGYHPIASHFHCIDLCDDLTLTAMPDWPASRIELDVAWAADALKPSAIDWPADKDLAVRAMAAAAARLRLEHGVAIKLRKRIPTGGGLGGGSADAGAVLRLCQLVLERNGGESAADAGWMVEAAASLGSDVAFFADPVGTAGSVAPRPAIVEGFGERHRRIERSHGYLVLIFPPFGCATPAVYRAFDSAVGHTLDTDRVVRSAAGLAGQPIADGTLFNDLAAAAMHVAPRLAEIAAAAAAIAHQPVHVSGSGSTLFLIAGRDAEAAGQLATKVFRATGCPAVAVRLV